MNITTQLEFVYRLALRDMKRLSSGYKFNVRCPICLEGKSKNKRRGYILLDPIKNPTYYCHNCGISIPFDAFLQKVNQVVYEDYKKVKRQELIESLKERKLTQKVETYEANDIANESELKYRFTLNEKNFVPANNIKIAVEYCRKRKIDVKGLFFCNKRGLPFSNMVIFPMYCSDGKLYGFQGRSTEKKRFYNFSPNENFKVWNIFKINPEETVYITEAIIDAMSINKNSIAMMGADLSANILDKIPNRVWCTDNDNRGYEAAEKLISKGEKIFLFPNKYLRYKDINELKKNESLPEKDIINLINKNTYSGFQARVKLNLIRSLKK